MLSPLTQTVLSNARRAGVSISTERAEQIAGAAQTRFDVFDSARQQLDFDAAPSFESALLATCATPELP
jgi:hypothetical protein